MLEACPCFQRLSSRSEPSLFCAPSPWARVNRWPAVNRTKKARSEKEDRQPPEIYLNFKLKNTEIQMTPEVYVFFNYQKYNYEKDKCRLLLVLLTASCGRNAFLFNSPLGPFPLGPRKQNVEEAIGICIFPHWQNPQWKNTISEGWQWAKESGDQGSPGCLRRSQTAALSLRPLPIPSGDSL